MKSKNLPKLYQYAVCPFCVKVKALLSYKKIPYEAIEVHPLNKKEIKFSKDYRKVPIFVDNNGTQINDSTPIMRFLDEKHPDHPVFEKDPKAREQEDYWVKWSDEVLVRALPPLIYRNISDAIEAFDYITKEGKFSWFQQRTIKYSGALVMTLIAKKTAKSQGIKDPKKHLDQCLQKWADALDDREYFGGTKPNGADLSIYGVLKSIEGMRGFSLIENTPKVFDWFQRVEAASLKSVQAA